MTVGRALSFRSLSMGEAAAPSIARRMRRGSGIVGFAKVLRGETSDLCMGSAVNCMADAEELPDIRRYKATSRINVSVILVVSLILWPMANLLNFLRKHF